MFTDHYVKLQKLICTNKQCDWQVTPTIRSAVGEKISPELLRVQAELGSQNTYRKSAGMLRLMVGRNRKVNNASRIHRTTNEIGEQVDKYRTKQLIEEQPTPAKELFVVVDGGHIHDRDHPGHNFEAMAAKVYKPENVVSVSKGKNIIKEKHCAGSAMKDDQETMKQKLIEAGQREGLTKETRITALADGANNCWNIIASLIPLCFVATCILDWFHIGKYAQTLKGQLPKQYEHFIDSAKTQLWYGEINPALEILKKLSSELTSAEHKEKVENFSNYIKDNREHIVNYDQRDQDGLIYTSHIAESTIEHYVNSRFKKKQKMQWKRKNAHAVLQIRASIIDTSWDVIWKSAANNLLTRCA
jgi:hypothetical protein